MVDMTLLGRLVEWLRRRKPAGDDVPRIILLNAQVGQSDVGPEPRHQPAQRARWQKRVERKSR